MTSTVFGTTIRGLIGDRAGKLLAEITPEWGPISWRLNDVGQASFFISAGDPKANSEFLRFGNRIFIEFDNGLPPWGGMIDQPRRWEGGRIQVWAYSGEYLLSLRHTIKERTFIGQLAGEIFRDLILEANAVADMGMIVDDVWYGGEGYSIALHFENLLTSIRNQLCSQMAGTDFAILPQLVNGNISFLANLYERRGRDKPTVVLIEGHNTTAESLLEQGVIINWLDVVGSGSGWGAERLSSNALDADSIATYGLRQKAAIFGNIAIQETLDAQAETMLADRNDPKNVLGLSALSLAPAVFADYEIGDSVRVQFHTLGFGGTDTTARITAREFYPATGECALSVEEVL